MWRYAYHGHGVEDEENGDDTEQHRGQADLAFLEVRQQGAFSIGLAHLLIQGHDKGQVSRIMKPNSMRLFANELGAVMKMGKTERKVRAILHGHEKAAGEPNEIALTMGLSLILTSVPF